MFLWAGGRRENILFRNPNRCDLSAEEAAPFDEIWFADLCPSQMRDPAGGKPFHVFDHHVSNAKKFIDDANCTFSMVHSGTSLLGEMTGVYDSGWINNKWNCDDHWCEESLQWERAKLVEALESYDLGRFDHEQGIMLADLASSFTQDEMLDILVKHEREVLSIPEYRGRVEALASMRKIHADAVVKNVLERDYKGIRMGIVTSPVYWKNEVAQRVLAAGFDLAVIVDTAGGMISLRSQPGGPDCSIIADRYGGGGHPRAAGFSVGPTKMSDELFNLAFG